MKNLITAIELCDMFLSMLDQQAPHIKSIASMAKDNRYTLPESFTLACSLITVFEELIQLIHHEKEKFIYHGYSDNIRDNGTIDDSITATKMSAFHTAVRLHEKCAYHAEQLSKLNTATSITQLGQLKILISALTQDDPSFELGIKTFDETLKSVPKSIFPQSFLSSLNRTLGRRESTAEKIFGLFNQTRNKPVSIPSTLDALDLVISGSRP